MGFLYAELLHCVVLWKENLKVFVVFNFFFFFVVLWYKLVVLYILITNNINMSK